MVRVKEFIRRLVFILDPVVALLAIVGYLGIISRRVMVGSEKGMPLTKMVFRTLGYLPITDHYYQPLTFSAKGFRYNENIANILFDGNRNFDYLNGISLPEEFVREYERGGLYDSGFRFGNGSFESGDAEVLHYMVRHHKPKKIVEIGAGHSSLIIENALKLNENDGSGGQHIIIEPYENTWLSELKSTLIREKVEDVDRSIFANLCEEDIVFIDSSHVLKAQNDCVYEYTELLPLLPSGIIVHIHDIFTPFDYPDDWLNDRYYLWAEQYIVEAILTNGNQWEIIAPLSWLSRDSEKFGSICPYFDATRTPGSLWIRKL